MNSIKHNLESLQSDINAAVSTSKKTSHCQLLCVTKYATLEQIKRLIAAGHTIFGENKVQDTEEKQSKLQNNALSWHMIGHLQRNKVKKAVQLYDCIQSVDSMRLLEKINDEASKLNKQQNIFIQLNITNNPQKHGFNVNDFEHSLETIFSFHSCKIKGIMTMGPNTNDINKIRQSFHDSYTIFSRIHARYPTVKELSMGMSHDYKIAIEEGSTLIRIGRLLYN